MNTTRTPQGQAMLRQLFLRPTLNDNVIVERQSIIQALLRPDNWNATTGLKKTLKKVVNMGKIFMRLKKGIASDAGGSSEEVDGKKIRGGSKSMWMAILQVYYFTVLCDKIH